MIRVKWHLEVTPGVEGGRLQLGGLVDIGGMYYWAESDAWPGFTVTAASLSELIQRVTDYAIEQGVRADELVWDGDGAVTELGAP